MRRRRAAQTPSSPPQPPLPPKPQRSPRADALALDIRLRLHSRLIEELDLAKLDKLDEKDLRREVMSLVADFARDGAHGAEQRRPAGAGRLDLRRDGGPGAAEPLLKDDSINDILINGPSRSMWSGAASWS